MANDPGFQALEARRQTLDAIRENSSRLASCRLTFETHGWGEVMLPNVQYFGGAFIDIPSVATGFALDGDTLVPTRFPRVTAGVYRWLQDRQGFYVGAWVFIVVDTQSPYIATTINSDPGYDMLHDFTFTGVATKALPAHLLEA